MSTKTSNPRPVAGEIVPAQASREIQPAKLDQQMATLARAVDTTAQSYAVAIRDAQGEMERALLMGQAIVALEHSITEKVMELIMPLVGSPNGIGSDRASERSKHPPYTAKEVRTALITSLIHGFRPVNNEWGLISGKFYGQKNGWRRKLADTPGISNIRITPGLPRIHEGTAIVRVALSWKINGVLDQLLDGEGKPGRPIAVHLYGGEKPDLVIGKAEAKAYRAAYLQATGSDFVPDENDAEPEMIEGKAAEALPAPSKAQQLEDRLRTPQRAAQQPQTQPARHPDYEAGERMAGEES